eukprot:15471314-Alexandrium_andersonii.AAC.1
MDPKESVRANIQQRTCTIVPGLFLPVRTYLKQFRAVSSSFKQNFQEQCLDMVGAALSSSELPETA